MALEFPQIKRLPATKLMWRTIASLYKISSIDVAYTWRLIAVSLPKDQYVRLSKDLQLSRR